jgi:Cns1/TTC4 Wheel domain
MFPPEAPPPEWDKGGQYVYDQLSIYAATSKGRLLKVGKKMTLRDVLSAAQSQRNDGLELKNGYLTFVILPVGDVEKKWIEEYKTTRSVQ